MFPCIREFLVQPNLCLNSTAAVGEIGSKKDCVSSSLDWVASQSACHLKDTTDSPGNTQHGGEHLNCACSGIQTNKQPTEPAAGRATSQGGCGCDGAVSSAVTLSVIFCFHGCLWWQESFRSPNACTSLWGLCDQGGVGWFGQTCVAVSCRCQASQGRTFQGPFSGAQFSSFKKIQARPARKKAECEKTPQCCADSGFVSYMIRGLMGLFLSLPWSPELNLVSYNSEELDLKPWKEGIRYMFRRLGHLILYQKSYLKDFWSCQAAQSGETSCFLCLYSPLKTEDPGLAMSRW